MSGERDQPSPRKGNYSPPLRKDRWVNGVLAPTSDEDMHKPPRSHFDGEEVKSPFDFRKGVIPYGYFFYPIFDAIFYKYHDHFSLKYYDECAKALKDAKERFKSSTARGIFKYALIKRVDLELQRVRLMRKVLEISKLVISLACILKGVLPTNEIEQLLDIRNIKGLS